MFHWDALELQVRVAGPVTPISGAESAVHFAGRPRKSRLAAWASPQGRPIAGREVLEAAMSGIDRELGEDVPLPPFWGGYRLRPTMLEFWQGRRSRLHDRFAYLRGDDGSGSGEAAWHVERLAP